MPGIDLNLSLLTTILDNSDKFKSILECPVCFEVPRSKPIFHCVSNGHLICGNCHPKLAKCPKCRGPLGNCRSLISENMLELVQLSHVCKFSKEGCEVELTGDLLVNHEKKCHYRLVNCPDVNCGAKISLSKVLDHMSNDHSEDEFEDWEGNEIIIPLEFDFHDINAKRCWTWITDRITFDGNQFFFSVQRMDEERVPIWNIWLSMLETTRSSPEDYIYTIVLKSPGRNINSNEVSFKGKPVSLDFDVEEVLNSGLGLAIFNANLVKILGNNEINIIIVIEKTSEEKMHFSNFYT